MDLEFNGGAQVSNAVGTPNQSLSPTLVLKSNLFFKKLQLLGRDQRVRRQDCSCTTEHNYSSPEELHIQFLQLCWSKGSSPGNSQRSAPAAINEQRNLHWWNKEQETSLLPLLLSGPKSHITKPEPGFPHFVAVFLPVQLLGCLLTRSGNEGYSK